MNDEVKKQIRADDPQFPAMKEKAKNLYMKFESITAIAHECNLGLNTLKSWIYGQNGKPGWEAERTLMQNSVIAELTKDKASKLKHTADLTVDLIHDYVKNLKEHKEQLDLKTVERLSSILTNLNKVIQFDKEHQPENSEKDATPISPEEIRKRLDVDPFSQSRDEKSVDAINQLGAGNP